jgi:L-Ala-D/L-Glu epimerase
MKITAVDVFPLRLPYRVAFTIARGSVGSPDEGAPHIYLRITADDGSTGWGEARPSHRWSYETEESVVSTLRNYLSPLLIGMNPADIAGIHHEMDRMIAPGTSTGQPIAKCAVDVALHDLVSRAHGMNVQELFGARGPQTINLVWTISDHTPDGAAKIAAKAIADGYRSVKVKLGISPEMDREILTAVKEVTGDAHVWADANQAYTFDYARSVVRTCEKLGIDVLEQPLPVNDLPGMARLAATSGIPLALDESVWSPEDLMQAIRIGALDILVVKISKMAGLRRVRQSIEMAQSAGLGVLGSSLTESAVGFIAAAHLNSAYNILYSDLNGFQFLADGPAHDQISIVNGTVELPQGHGLGIEVAEQDVRRFLAPSEKG